ncbi:hypothetical protein B0H21DRAFT_705332 [Amylocystis lapponica]|nr:hypothetical protein B0H21DRAFT_705332 [Amylocystis lapponica]
MLATLLRLRLALSTVFSLVQTTGHNICSTAQTCAQHAVGEELRREQRGGCIRVIREQHEEQRVGRTDLRAQGGKRADAHFDRAATEPADVALLISGLLPFVDALSRWRGDARGRER